MGARGRGNWPPPVAGPVLTQDVKRERSWEGNRVKERQPGICHSGPEHRVPQASLGLTLERQTPGFLSEAASCWEGGGKQDPEWVWARELSFSSKENICSQSDDQNPKS